MIPKVPGESMSVIVAALLFAAGAPAADQTLQPQAVPVTASRPADWAARLPHGIALAQAMQPEELVVGPAMQAIRQGLASTLRDSPEIKKIEAAHPGFTDRYSAASVPELEKMFHKRMPDLWQQLGEALATTMTVAELDQATQFYTSPAGQEFLRLGVQNTDLQPYLAQGVKQGMESQADQKAGEEQLAKGATGSFLATLGAMSQADRDAYSAFLASPGGSGLMRAGPSISAVLSSWMSDDDPEASAAMAGVARHVLEELDAQKAAKPQ